MRVASTTNNVDEAAFPHMLHVLATKPRGQSAVEELLLRTL
ncbi:hypothetical protein [Litoreibacter meonggei]|nr:hypothetical protein [Litoreibacter meonggei]